MIRAMEPSAQQVGSAHHFADNPQSSGPVIRWRGEQLGSAMMKLTINVSGLTKTWKT